MKTIIAIVRPFILPLACLLIFPVLSKAANFTWSGASGANVFWNTPANWSPSGPPGVNDAARFFDPGATNVLGTAGINNEMTSNLAINTLWLSQTNNFHNLFIDTGVTLTVSGNNFNGYGPLGSDPTQTSPTNGLSTVYAGTRDPVATGTVVSNTISGGGTLVVSNVNNELNVRQVFAGGGGAHQAVLDMSGLTTFIARLGRIRVGDGEAAPLSRAQGQLRLAATNAITLTGTNSADNVQLVVGNNDVNNNGNSSVSFLLLGQTNRLNVDRILIGGQKQQGQILFNPVFASPSMVLRGSDGASRVTSVRIGDESDTGATGSPTTGGFNLLAGTSDIMVDTLIVGKSQNGNNTSAATGNLLLGTGTLNVNSLIMGAQANSGYGGTVTGNATFSNSTVTVNTLLQLGVSAGSVLPRVSNLNVSGGSMTVNGTYKNQGTVNINVTNSTLTLPSAAAITARNIQLDGGTLANTTSLKVTNQLNVYNNGYIPGSPILDLGNNTTPAAWDVQGITNGSLIVGSTLQGRGTISGNVIQAAGATVSPGGVGLVGTLAISGTSGTLTLNNAGTLNFDLSGSSAGANDQITASGAVTVNGTNNVFLKSLAGTLDTASPYTLMTAGTLTATTNQFKVVGPLTTGRYTFGFDLATVPNTVLLVVGGTGPANQTWVGDGSSNVWDAQGATNWNNGAPSQFFNLDNVSFNDAGSATPAISLSGALVTGSMSTTNTAKNYAMGGNGSLSVAGQFTKSGTGSLVISNNNDNSFSSLVAITNGAVTFANNGQNTFSSGINLAGGSLTLSGNSTNAIVDPNTGTPVIIVGAGTTLSIVNSNANTFNGTQMQLDGTLAFNQPVDVAFDSVLINAGALTKSGTGKLTMAGNNSGYSGPVQINGGTVIAGNTVSALGTASITIANNAALDVNGKNLGALPITVSGSGPTGAGALVNFGGPQNTSLVTAGSALHNVTLTANTTLGGSGPWNTDPIQNVGYFVITDNLSTGGTNYNLTKTGLNQISLMNATVDPALGNIDVQQGMLNFHGTTTSMGDPGSNITVSAGATLSFYDTTTAWDKKIVLTGDGTTPNIFNYNGTHTVVGAVTLNGNCVFGGAPVGRGVPVSLTFNGPIGGSGSLTKSASDTLGAVILAATNNYSGTTTVAGGALLVDGVIQSTASVTVSAGKLGGLGAIRGPVTIQAGGTLSPGDLATPLGTLSISNSLSLAGTTAMDLNKSGATLTSDLVTNISTLSISGTLQVNMTGDPLAAGDSFKLLSFTSASGSFASVVPATPGPGLKWVKSALNTSGTLSVGVASRPAITGVATIGGNVVMSGTNGEPGNPYWVLSSTDVSLPIASWTPIATNYFDGSGNFNFTNGAPTDPQRFYVLQNP